MKGLLLKDIYTLTKQMKIFLVMIALFALTPGFSVSSFAVIYASMLPITALAYDERSKWNDMAAMMPYSRTAVVLSKYLLGYISTFAAAILTIAAQLAVSLFTDKGFGSEESASIVIFLALGLTFLAINMPFMFRFGVEKGRFVFMGMIALVVIGGGVFAGSIEGMELSADLNIWLFAAAALLFAAVLNVLSVFVSRKAYERRR